MPTITAIKPQIINKQVYVYLDGKFGFGLDLENFVKLKLTVEQELSEEDIKNISEKGDKAKTFNKILNFAIRRPRSEKEFLDYMKRKRIDVSVHRYIIKKLQKLKLLNDLEFAKWWTTQRLEFKSKSKKAIKFELRIKGVKQDIIDDVLENTELDEIKMARELIAKKSYKWHRFDDKTRHQKIAQYLLSKGFGWHVINDVLE